MSLGQVNSSLNLSGQGGAAATAARMAPIPAAPHVPAAGPVIVEPKLGIAWGDFHQGFFSGVRAFFTGPFTLRKFLGSEYFRDCWVERRIPKRAVLAAALWHVAFLVAPFSLLTATLRHNSAFDHMQLTWSGPIEDFPLLEIRAAKPKPLVARHGPTKLLTPKSADAFHPRQRIVTDPVRPNHPRQTLIHPAAPKLAQQMAPALPNIVQLQGIAAPARPRVAINADALAKLHPRAQRRVVTSTEAPAPDVAALDQKSADITLNPAVSGPARPKLELNPGAAPRLAQRSQTGDTVAPEVAVQNGNAPSTLIALSASPAPPKPEVQPPAGYLAARVSISPEGKPGASSGAPTNASAPAAGKSDVGISISGANPQPKSNPSGNALGARSTLNLPSAHSLMTRSEPKADDPADASAPPNFSALPPGAKPEQAFASKRIYTLAVNMANLNSSSGSWILHFAELGSSSAAAYSAGTAATPSTAADLAMPVPTRKLDPKYPPDLIEQNIQGEVVLYGVVRADGSVNNIQVVRSLDPQLDANAKSAFAQWKFSPASKAGTPVDLQVIAHIPFKIRDDR
jgi:protein TonB